MALGLNEQELNALLSFGNTAKEIEANLFGSMLKDATGIESIYAAITTSLIDKMAKVVSENNKRITEQLIAAGIKISD
jgi:hypothetical protein